MDPFIQNIENINTIDDAIKLLNSKAKITPKLNEIIDFVINAHEGQFRKSGEPYSVHPLLVASIVSQFAKDEEVSDIN